MLNVGSGVTSASLFYIVVLAALMAELALINYFICFVFLLIYSLYPAFSMLSCSHLYCHSTNKASFSMRLA